MKKLSLKQKKELLFEVARDMAVYGSAAPCGIKDELFDSNPNNFFGYAFKTSNLYNYMLEYLAAGRYNGNAFERLLRDCSSLIRLFFKDANKHAINKLPKPGSLNAIRQIISSAA